MALDDDLLRANHERRREQMRAAGDESEPAVEEEVRFEIPAITAPTFPWEIVLHDSHTWYQRLVGGGMAVKLVAIAQTLQGRAPIPPGIVIEFSADGWERFKREVANDGEKAPVIETVRAFPGGLLNGEDH